MSSSSSSAPVNENGWITSLNDFDVLLGRGQAATNNRGNINFRTLVDARRKKYKTNCSRNEKRRIGREIHEEITANGGRFLKLVEQILGDEGDVYEEASIETSLEKCMQALREKQQKKKGETETTPNVSSTLTGTFEANASPTPDESQSGRFFGQETFNQMVGASLNATDATVLDWQGALLGNSSETTSETTDLDTAGELLMNNNLPADPSVSSILPETLYGQAATGIPPAFVDSRLLLYQPFASQQQLLANAVLQSQLRQFMLQRPFIPTERNMTTLPQDTNDSSEILKPYSTCTQGENEDSDILDESLLSMLGLGPEVPRFTGKDVITEEERVSVLSDMLGHMHLEGHHQKKRAKREFDPATVSFLVRQMKLVLEQMSDDEKQILLEVAAKCHPEELCDARLKQFLRSQGMNVKLASERFVNYWKERRDLFGEEKYCQRMILSEALRDDIIALKAGVFSILPHRDLSGRHILFVHPSRHSREGYNSKSLLRALWYLIEVIVEESEHNHFIILVCDKETTIWDFDPYLHNRMTYFLRSCWPMKDPPTHVCNSPPIILRLIKPVICALLGKEARSRLVEHDASNESSLFESLSRFGIMKHMLPHYLGGPVRLDLEGWIFFRRSLEEEI